MARFPLQNIALSIALPLPECLLPIVHPGAHTHAIVHIVGACNSGKTLWLDCTLLCCNAWLLSIKSSVSFYNKHWPSLAMCINETSVVVLPFKLLWQVPTAVGHKLRAVLEILWPSGSVIAVWPLSKVLRSSRLPVFECAVTRCLIKIYNPKTFLGFKTSQTVNCESVEFSLGYCSWTYNLQYLKTILIKRHATTCLTRLDNCLQRTPLFRWHFHYAVCIIKCQLYTNLFECLATCVVNRDYYCSK